MRGKAILHGLIALMSALAFTGRRGGMPELSAPAQQASTERDTVQYDDSVFSNQLFSVRDGDRVGVWFTPRHEAPCRLVAIHYLFSRRRFPSPADSVVGFVNQVQRYRESGPRLLSDGEQVANFQFMPDPEGEITTVAPGKSGVPVRPSFDLFIGWVSSGVDTFTHPVGLRDSIASFDPPRSYFRRGTRVRPLPFDIGVRAVFECDVAPADSGSFTFELRWNRRETDLDLYLVNSALLDTISWRNMEGARGGELDVDDNDGFGPERLTHPFNAAMPATPAHLGVYYYGSKTRRPTHASVLVFRNGALAATLGPCLMRPGDWWSAARLDLRNGRFFPDTTCGTISRPSLAAFRKNIAFRR